MNPTDRVEPLSPLKSRQLDQATPPGPVTTRVMFRWRSNSTREVSASRSTMVESRPEEEPRMRLGFVAEPGPLAEVGIREPSHGKKGEEAAIGRLKSVCGA
jgi:hypothetical protein